MTGVGHFPMKHLSSCIRKKFKRLDINGIDEGFHPDCIDKGRTLDE